MHINSKHHANLQNFEKQFEYKGLNYNLTWLPFTDFEEFKKNTHIL